MADDRSIIKLTPDGYLTQWPNVTDVTVYTIDCSDLGGLGLYTSNNWAAAVEIFMTTWGGPTGYTGITHYIGFIKNFLTFLSANDLLFDTTAQSIDTIGLEADGTDINVKITVKNTLDDLYHTIYVVCYVYGE